MGERSNRFRILSTSVKMKKVYLAASTVFLTAIPCAFSANYTGADNGEYTLDSNWSTGTVPSNQNAVIQDKNVTSNGDVTNTGRLMLGGNDGGAVSAYNGSLTIQSGTLTFGGNDYSAANYIGVNSSGSAVLTLNGGNFVSTTGSLWLAGNSSVSSTAAVNVYAGSSLILQSTSAGHLRMGNNNTGTVTTFLNLHGGTVSIGGQLDSGYSANKTGTINVYSGTSLTAGSTRFSYDAGGTTHLNLTVDAANWQTIEFGTFSKGAGTVDGSITLTGDSLDYFLGQELLLWHTSSGILDGSSFLVDNEVAGLDGIFGWDAGRNAYIFTVTAIPEPSVYAFSGTAMIMGIVFLRRRRVK